MGSPNLNETLFTTMVADDIFLKPNRPALVVSSTSWWVVLFYFSCSHWWATYMPQLLSNIRLWCHWHIWWFLQFSFSLYNIISLTGCLKFVMWTWLLYYIIVKWFFPFYFVWIGWRDERKWFNFLHLSVEMMEVKGEEKKYPPSREQGKHRTLFKFF